MIAVKQAKNLILKNTKTPAPVKFHLAKCLGLVLAENITAKENIPFSDNSAVDGYAVKFSDTKNASVENPAKLSLLEILPAGKVAQNELQNGKTIKIMTGAPIPKGANSVVMVEQTKKNDNQILVFKEVKEQQNIRKAGEDISIGTQVLSEGKILTSADLGVLASVGKLFPLVFPKPRVAILVTGDEIIAPNEPLTEGKVRNSNEFTLCGQVTEFGGIPFSHGIGKDSKEELKKQVLNALENADILVTSGGVSMGDFDFVQQVFPEIGAEIIFHKVNVKPGKPVLFCTFGKKLIFGLPGNPVSSMVAFLQFVVPAMKKMAGFSDFSLPKTKAIFKGNFSKQDDKTHFLRGILQKEGENFTVSLTGTQSSGVLRSMSLANCLLEVSEEKMEIKDGEEIFVEMF
ncbi:molybdopterin molybdotransferase MoeA [bacterium]|nr:molybdopterin molybdotransferase MoeA [bacterium]